MSNRLLCILLLPEAIICNDCCYPSKEKKSKQSWRTAHLITVNAPRKYLVGHFTFHYIFCALQLVLHESLARETVVTILSTQTIKRGVIEAAVENYISHRLTTRDKTLQGEIKPHQNERVFTAGIKPLKM